MQSLLPDDPKQVGKYSLLGRLGQGPRGIVYLARLSQQAETSQAPAEQGAQSEETPAAEQAERTPLEASEAGEPSVPTKPVAPAEAAAPAAAEASEAPGEPERLFVVKLLPLWPEADPATRARVVDDLSAAQRVSSAYAVRAVDAGWIGDRAYVVREHVEGRTLREAVAADGPITGDALERIAVGTLTALTAVHLAGIAHRGLTPQNILLTAEGPRVCDFGLGETAYRSPEQVRGEPTGPAADLFAWASTITYAATGTEPFGDDPEAIVTAQPDLAALPAGLRDVVASCLNKMPAQRPTAQGAMLWLLGEEKTAPPVSAMPAPPVPAPAPFPMGGPDGQTWVEAHAAPYDPAMDPRLPEGEPAVWSVSPEPQVAQVWEEPELPSEQREVPALPPSNRQQPAPAAPAREKTGPRFPVGLAAGVGIVIGLSGLGLWGANHYAASQEIGRVAAEGQVNPTSVPEPSGGLGNVKVGGGGTSAPRPEITVPWANSPDPQQTGVYPMELTTPAPSLGAVPSLTPGPQFTPPPIPTSVPTSSQSPTQPVTPTPTVTVTKTASPTVTPSGEATPKPTPTPTEVDPSPSPTPSGTGSPTPDPSASDTPTPTPTPSSTDPQPVGPTVTPSPTQPESPKPTHSSPKPTATRTVAPRPTATRTTSSPKPTHTTSSPRPTATRTTSSPKPTVTATKTVAPKPTATRTTSSPKPTTSSKPPAPASNPYTPQQVCNSAGQGSGYYVQRQGSFDGGVTYLLYSSSSGTNCVVTMKTDKIGESSTVAATLEVQGSSPRTESGSFKYYAGPVIAEAKGKCVRFAGSTSSGSTSAPFGNCG
ncbi:serine/threonine protein kinase [Sphaerisporangium fuscum]|uniref:serine/threonine protein kinase n=1 Tax=Sphaerisporangium fuscum TaxID=2835868 RepID=UPI001BDDBB06|nr:serine/threonine-protein kinase [Sphaerisporangium fuscum]